MSDRLANRLKRVRKMFVSSYSIVDCTNAKEELLAKMGGESNEHAIETSPACIDKSMLQGLKKALQADIRNVEERHHVRFVSYSTDKEENS